MEPSVALAAAGYTGERRLRLMDLGVVACLLTGELPESAYGRIPDGERCVTLSWQLPAFALGLYGEEHLHHVSQEEDGEHNQMDPMWDNLREILLLPDGYDDLLDHGETEDGRAWNPILLPKSHWLVRELGNEARE